jgi:hypothetical protein
VTITELRARASSAKAGATITHPAAVAASCCRYFGWERKRDRRRGRGFQGADAVDGQRGVAEEFSAQPGHDVGEADFRHGGVPARGRITCRR